MTRTPEQDIAACRAFALQLRDYGVARVLNDAADRIERIDGDRLSQASVVLHQQGYHDLGEYLDSLWNPQCPNTQDEEGGPR